MSWVIGYLAAITLRAAAAECDADLTKLIDKMSEIQSHFQVPTVLYTI